MNRALTSRTAATGNAAPTSATLYQNLVAGTTGRARQIQGPIDDIQTNPHFVQFTKENPTMGKVLTILLAARDELMLNQTAPQDSGMHYINNAILLMSRQLLYKNTGISEGMSTLHGQLALVNQMNPDAPLSLTQLKELQDMSKRADRIAREAATASQAPILQNPPPARYRQPYTNHNQYGSPYPNYAASGSYATHGPSGASGFYATHGPYGASGYYPAYGASGNVFGQGAGRGQGPGRDICRRCLQRGHYAAQCRQVLPNMSMAPSGPQAPSFPW